MSVFGSSNGGGGDSGGGLVVVVVVVGIVQGTEYMLTYAFSLVNLVMNHWTEQQILISISCTNDVKRKPQEIRTWLTIVTFILIR